MSSTRTNDRLLKLATTAAITAASLTSSPTLLAAPPTEIVVATTAELEAALSPSNAGARILVRAGDYDLGQGLTVPEGATVVGEGTMSFDGSGLPTGIEPFGRTLLRATIALAGDVLTLGDGSRLKGLVIEDVAGRAVAGNAVAVVSRAAGDVIEATIVQCEILNPSPAGAAPQGPTGRGVAVVTRNPNAGFDPPPHEGAFLSVTIRDSIIRSPGRGNGVMAINFAPLADIQLDLRNNVIGGTLHAIGGVGRPDAVTASAVIIRSNDNLYRSDSSLRTEFGWSFLGGSDAPSPMFVSQASTFNVVQIRSRNDRIEDFAIGIIAEGGQRLTSLSAPISANSVDLKLHGTRLVTTTADLRLYGAFSLVEDPPTGDENTLRVLMRQATGSGPRDNVYVHSWTPSMVNLGTGNELEMIGSAIAFDSTNDDFVPPPPAEFFSR